MKLLSRVSIALVLALTILTSFAAAEEYSFSREARNYLIKGQTVKYDELFTITDAEVTDITFRDGLKSDVVKFDNEKETLTALKEGTVNATIHVSFIQKSTGKAASQEDLFTFIVEPEDQEVSVSLDENINVEFNKSKTYQLKPEFDPNIFGLKWRVLDYKLAGNFATVSTTGLITARSEGSGKLDLTLEYNYAGKTLKKDFSVNLTVSGDASDQFIVEPKAINEPFVMDKSYTVKVTVPQEYQDVTPKWSSDDENICYVRGQDGGAILMAYGVGQTVIHARYDDVDVKINVNFTFSGEPYKSITTDRVKELYQKYLEKYPKRDDNPLSISKDGILDSNSHITDYGREVSLNVLNFYRELSGSTVVDPWDAELTNQAQAGVDYLANNDLEIDHSAADDSGDELAKKGLNSSNLYSSPDPVQSLSAYFNDVNNKTSFNTGHRNWMIHPQIRTMGIASSKNASALNVLGKYEPDDSTIPVVCYPFPGESPIELITIDTSGIPLWTVGFGSYYKPASDFKALQLNVTDNTGKSVDYVYSESPNNEGAWFNSNNNGIKFNPYPLVDGNYQNGLNKTYTITIKGLRGVSDTLQYETHICKLKNVLNGIDSDAVEIYRLYNETSGEHLYTSDENEYNTLPGMGWTQEGTGWVAPDSGTAVYRLYNPVLADHLYTTDENEVRVLTTERGWQADYNGKPLFYSGGNVPVYRLYHDGIYRHLLTRDENENNVLGTERGWRQEGVGLYAIS